MNFLIIADNEEEKEQVIAHARRFSKDAKLYFYPEIPDQLWAIFVPRGKRFKAEQVNKQRLKEGLQEAAIVEVPIKKKKLVIKNPIRARIATLLKEKPSYGYELLKRYKQRFGEISTRLFYYHLHKGLEEGIFALVDVKEEEGSYSWGRLSMRKYYKLNV